MVEGSTLYEMSLEPAPAHHLGADGVRVQRPARPGAGAVAGVRGRAAGRRLHRAGLPRHLARHRRRAAHRAPRPAARRAGALQRSLASPAALGLAPALAELDLVELNALLYRCDAEEREAGGGGVYDVPGHGPLAYAGLQGAAALLAQLAPADDLGHALCANLRAGDWLADYTWRRLDAAPRLQPVAARVRALLQPLAALPRFLQPAYFEALLSAVYREATRAALARLRSPRGAFGRALALTSVQLVGAVPSAPLPACSPALAPPRAALASMSAGLPHFAVGYMRCWGRDTFVALRGLLLLTGRYQDARMHILGFAACLRHGLIPNLLDAGRNARYNCRDAVWWWLQSIKQYCSEAPGGGALLAEPVSRLFPQDDADAAPPGAADQPLHDVMQEALDVHFQVTLLKDESALLHDAPLIKPVLMTLVVAGTRIPRA
ncbi:hypothetical protein HF086_016265 [Spodoptera exigua]|uniref:Glycogen debranching enzyme n=1 Tax=Spodoptera exigua TaxID=7107 RepID=A0A922MY00_SPOEX|nr:hypothetical protein HF086_016265 [Spodoptera exigua]